MFQLRRPPLAARATAWLPVAVVALAALGGCKSSAEDEQQQHARLPAEVQRYAARYPAFASVLQAELARAKEAFAHASAEASGEQRVKRMRAANSIASGRIGELKSYERSAQALRRLLRSPAIRRQPRATVDQLLRDGEGALDDARAIVSRPVHRVSELTAAIANAGGLLRAAIRPLQRIQDRVDQQRREQLKAERAARKAPQPVQKKKP